MLRLRHAGVAVGALAGNRGHAHHHRVRLVLLAVARGLAGFRPAPGEFDARDNEARDRDFDDQDPDGAGEEWKLG
ncbi:MAG: hypothetical protein H0U67_04760 [Gemmatimonadetes bacterium]|nr:hypothetical protein [Gemmatimonadota bacterium]